MTEQEHLEVSRKLALAIGWKPEQIRTMRKQKESRLTYQRLTELLSYDPNTGVFTRAKSLPGYSKGEVAGGSDGKGYQRIKVDGCFYLSHRLAWLYVHGEWPKDMIDHINRDKSDNRICNLRPADSSLNNRNKDKRVDNTTGETGVTFFKKTGTWVARVQVNGVAVLRKTFKSFSEAVEARDSALAVIAAQGVK